jgi:hypothetical protein
LKHDAGDGAAAAQRPRAGDAYAHLTRRAGVRHGEAITAQQRSGLNTNGGNNAGGVVELEAEGDGIRDVRSGDRDRSLGAAAGYGAAGQRSSH